MFRSHSKNDNHQKLLIEARKAFAREEREKACHLFVQSGLHENSDADLRDIGDFLVVATEFRPDLALDLAQRILDHPDPLPPVYIQDVFCASLFLADRELERRITKRVMAGKLNPNLCVRIADMYDEYGATPRDRMKGSLWIIRAAQAEAQSFSDWAAKAYALHLAVEDDEKARLAVLGCAQLAAELAETDQNVVVEALEDLIDALSFLEYEGSLIARHLYERILKNNHIALPEKHRIWQDLKELQSQLDN